MRRGGSNGSSHTREVGEWHLPAECLHLRPCVWYCLQTSAHLAVLFIKFQTLRPGEVETFLFGGPPILCNPIPMPKCTAGPSGVLCAPAGRPLTAAGQTPVAAEEGRSLGWPVSDGGTPPHLLICTGNSLWARGGDWTNPLVQAWHTVSVQPKGRVMFFLKNSETTHPDRYVPCTYRPLRFRPGCRSACPLLSQMASVPAPLPVLTVATSVSLFGDQKYSCPHPGHPEETEQGQGL